MMKMVLDSTKSKNKICKVLSRLDCPVYPHQPFYRICNNSDNAYVGSFFGSLKNEWLNGKIYETYEYGEKLWQEANF